jgi:hypothetical protein
MKELVYDRRRQEPEQRVRANERPPRLVPVMGRDFGSLDFGCRLGHTSTVCIRELVNSLVSWLRV